MRVLLINAPVWKYSGYPARSNPGMGLLYVGAVLREKGHTVRIIDAEAMGWWHKELLVTIDSWKPTHIGIGCLSQGLQSAIDVVRLIKEHHPEIWITLGGPGPSAAAIYALQKSQCDNVTVGEAELVLDESFSKCGITIGIPPEDLDALPQPAYDLMEPRIGSNMWYGNLPTPPLDNIRETVVMWSRSCPHPCTFCSKASVPRGKPRRRNPKRVVEELKTLKSEFGINSVFVYDDELIGMSEEHNEWLLEICTEIYCRGLGLKLKGQGRCSERFIDETLFHVMNDAGFFAMMMGCESGSEKVKKRIKKGTTNDDIRFTLKALRANGLSVYGFWMIGMPEETGEEAAETQRLIAEMAPYMKWIQVTAFSPLPGSEFFDEAIDTGWLCGNVPEGEARFHRALEMMAPNFQTTPILDMPWLRKDEILAWQKKLYETWEGHKNDK